MQKLRSDKALGGSIRLIYRILAQHILAHEFAKMNAVLSDAVSYTAQVTVLLNPDLSLAAQWL